LRHIKEAKSEVAVFELREHNSGGSFWLDRDQYDRLIDSGQWHLDKDIVSKIEHGRFQLGDEKGVPYSWRRALVGEFECEDAAVESFESLTGESYRADGCRCCGPPFYISERRQGAHQ